jgi:DtxR family transcriptional regulator, Mn-dependent transcriptional regulator
MSTAGDPSHAVQDYLKAIYMLGERRSGPVSTKSLASWLAVSPASASGMLKRLAARGLVQHLPYHGASLTERGRQVALRVVRKHRVLETFLVQVLGMTWDRVHAEAEVLEHYVSDEVLDLMAAKLGHPTRDPHGDPIPARDLTVPVDTSVILTELGVGDCGILTRVIDRDPSQLRLMTSLHIALGDRLRVERTGSELGPMRVSVSGTTHLINHPLASAMRVAPVPHDEAPSRARQAGGRR